MNEEPYRDTQGNGRGAIVTGAGSGVGRALALAFAAVGYRVLAADLDAQAAAETAELHRGNGDIIHHEANVASSSDVNSMVERAHAEFGSIAVLCNNAGIGDDFKLADELEESLWDRVIDVNLKSAYLTCHAAIPLMLEQGEGVIINTCSISSVRGGRGGLAYTVSKHGMLGLTRQIAASHGEDGIRSNAICPAGIQTPFIGKLPKEVSVRAQRLQSHFAAGKPDRVDPAQIADIAVFLASPQARIINGQEILADRGWLEW